MSMYRCCQFVKGLILFLRSLGLPVIVRDIAKQAYKRQEVTKEHYHGLRNAATNLIKKGKYDYLHPKFSARLGTKALWQNLCDVGAVSSLVSLQKNIMFT